MVGVAELIVIDLASVASIALANGRGSTGAIVIFNYASQVFNAVCAVLATSIVTSTFPVLSAREGEEFDQTSAGSTRAVLLMSWLGTAVIAAVAVPAAHVLAKEPDQVPDLIWSFALFAPGIAGTAVVANLSRVMFAIGRLKVAAAALTGSWLLVIASEVVLAELAPPHLVSAALALGNTIGQTAIAIPMVLATRRICGKAAVAGVGRAALVGLAAGAVGTAAALAATLVIPVSGKLLAVAAAVLAAACAVIAFAAVAYLLDQRDTRTALSRLARLSPRRKPRQAGSFVSSGRDSDEN
jgi:putative peptidoglycan lipid II flippase